MEATVSPTIKPGCDGICSQPHHQEGLGAVTQLGEPGTAFHLLLTLFHLLQYVAPSEAIGFGDTPL